MKLKIIIHEAEEGGLWAEVPAIPGCATQGETLEELISNLYEAVEGCLSVAVAPSGVSGEGSVTAIIQTGRSVEDPNTIAVADAHDMAMVFTGIRQFLQ